VAEEGASARGVIRWKDVPFLSEYGTAHALYDELEDAYSYAIKSESCHFSEYVGLRAEASGPVNEVGKKLAVMNVARIQLPSGR
jgi:tRNA isopentenyl-2-thiomethyl-A-37 hydroxylase MiaE